MLVLKLKIIALPGHLADDWNMFLRKTPDLLHNLDKPSQGQDFRMELPDFRYFFRLTLRHKDIRRPYKYMLS